MTVAGENNALLTQILGQVTNVAADVAVVKETMGRLDERVKTTVDASIDHEERLRRLEEIRDVYVTKAGVWRVASFVALVSSGFTGVLVAFWLNH